MTFIQLNRGVTEVKMGFLLLFLNNISLLGSSVIQANGVA